MGAMSKVSFETGASGCLLGHMRTDPVALGSLLINDIVFQENDWRVMLSTPFAEFHEAW